MGRKQPRKPALNLIYFTKFLAGMNSRQIGDHAKRLGVDGLDLAVRSGQAVNPENVTEALPEAMRVWRSLGLTVPLVTLEGGAVDPSDPSVIRVFEACGQAGIGLVKLGYWRWAAGHRYWEEVSRIRDAVAGFEALGRRVGVTSLIHTHSHGCYGCNASSAMHLLKGFDPNDVGIYLDLAHLAIEGEPFEMATDIAGAYLKMVAAKNVRYLAQWAPMAMNWSRDWCLLHEGIADVAASVAHLKTIGYRGPISLHGEYSKSQELERMVAMVQQDVAYLRRCDTLS